MQYLTLLTKVLYIYIHVRIYIYILCILFHSINAQLKNLPHLPKHLQVCITRDQGWLGLVVISDQVFSRKVA